MHVLCNCACGAEGGGGDDRDTCIAGSLNTHALETIFIEYIIANFTP